VVVLDEAHCIKNTKVAPRRTGNSLVCGHRPRLLHSSVQDTLACTDAGTKRACVAETGAIPSPSHPVCSSQPLPCARSPPQAKRTRAAIPILQAASRAILLTGTPTLSRPGELLPQLQVGTSEPACTVLRMRTQAPVTLAGQFRVGRAGARSNARPAPIARRRCCRARASLRRSTLSATASPRPGTTWWAGLDCTPGRRASALRRH
jgi:hypothetical protein